MAKWIIVILSSIYSGNEMYLHGAPYVQFFLELSKIGVKGEDKS